MSDYRIEYTILRAEDDSDDFHEIGFGASGTCTLRRTTTRKDD